MTGEDGVMTEAPDAMVPMAVQNNLLEGRKLLESMEPQQRLAWGLEQFGETFALTTSFGIQSAVLLHMLSTLPGGDAVPVIWIDTGYLPPETYTYASQLTQQLRIRLVVSQSEMSPARMEALHGRLWESGRVEDLETYHRIRKVEPLEPQFTGAINAKTGQHMHDVVGFLESVNHEFLGVGDWRGIDQAGGGNALADQLIGIHPTQAALGQFLTDPHGQWHPILNLALFQGPVIKGQNRQADGEPEADQGG